MTTQQIAQRQVYKRRLSNANYIHNEVTTTNEESIKDVQDAQSSLMKAIQILTDFYAKAGEGNDLTQQNQFSETHYTLKAGVIVTLEDHEDTLHKWLGRINSYLLVL